MKIAYITNASAVGGWAHSVQIVNMCSAFGSNGADVTLFLPYRKIFAHVDLFEYYNIPKNFSVKMLPCIDISVGSPHPFFYWLRFISFYVSARFYLWFRSFDVFYSRDLYSALFFPSIVLEQHSFPKNVGFFHKIILSHKRKIITLTSFIKNKCINVGVDAENIMVSPSGVDIDEYKIQEKHNHVNIYGISKSDFVFGYIGTLKTMNMEKGVSDCLRALKLLPDGYKFLVVGGEEPDVLYYKKISSDMGVSDRVIFVGKVPYSEVPAYTIRCDVLAAPFPENEHYSYYMSPLKIFEYMASKKPIIVSDLPSLREVLEDEITALFIPPSNPTALSEAIQKLRVDSELSKKLSDNAYREVVEKYTWKKRAENILKFIEAKNI